MYLCHKTEKNIIYLIRMGVTILLIVWLCLSGTEGPNRYGADPTIDNKKNEGRTHRILPSLFLKQAHAIRAPVIPCNRAAVLTLLLRSVG